MTEVYNFFTNIPSIILLILMTYLLRPSFSTVYIALSITGWIYMARFMRNQILIIRDREYNLASRCLGTPAYRMIIKNLLPHLVSVIIMRMAVAIPSTISAESVITFLGIGLPNDTPSLGVLLSNARSSMDTRPHLLFIPAVVMTLVTLTFYIAGNAFSDASDPRNHT
jgi:oligopeptide transport system permease protein